MVIACVMVISKLLDKLTIVLRKPDAWQTRLESIKVMRLGGDIAAWCAFLGLRVTLADMKPEPIASALKRAEGLY
jgi:hypothetical protein